MQFDPPICDKLRDLIIPSYELDDPKLCSIHALDEITMRLSDKIRPGEKENAQKAEYAENFVLMHFLLLTEIDQHNIGDMDGPTIEKEIDHHRRMISKGLDTLYLLEMRLKR